MKRIIALLLAMVLIVFGLSGCIAQKSNVPLAMPSSFEMDLHIIINESDLKAHMKQQSIGNCSLAITAPESLAGMNLSFENNACKMEFKGLKYAMDFSKFPETAFGSALINTLIAVLDKTKVEITKVNSNWQYKGECASGSFLLIQNGETGAPVYISVPSLDLTIEFSNFISNK